MLPSGARIYISHHTRDRALAERIGLALGAAGHETFSGRDDIEPGVDWRASVRLLVTTADVVLVLWTASGASSEWVNEEASLAVEEGKYVGVRFGGVELPSSFAVLKHVTVDDAGEDLGPIVSALGEFERRAPRSPRRRPSPPPPPAPVADEPPSASPAETPAPPASGYDVFISYSRKDGEACALLFQMLAEAGLNAWYDKDIGSGQFKAKIVNRISTAPVFVLLLSHQSVTSPNVRKELGVASSSQRWIIPISIDGITVAELEDTFKYELIELNVFSADPAAPTSWSDAVSAILGSVHELRGATALAPLPPVASPAPVREARPRGGRRWVLLAAVAHQAAAGFLLWRAGWAPEQAVAGAVLAGALVQPLAFASAWLARGAFAP